MVSVECNGRPIMGSPFPVFFSAAGTTYALWFLLFLFLNVVYAFASNVVVLSCSWFGFTWLPFICMIISWFD